MCNKIISKGILATVAVTVLLSGMVLGCKQASGGGGDDSPIETINFVKMADNYYQYKTNDSQYCGSYCCLGMVTPAVGNTLSIKCKKVSGYTNCGIGMLCFKKDWENYCIVSITPTGYYGVFMKVGGKWKNPDPLGWTPSVDIKGMGEENTIAVNLEKGSTTTYEIRINGNLQTKIFENTDLSFTDECGFVATISTAENENFPSVSTDMRFMMVSPIK